LTICAKIWYIRKEVKGLAGTEKTLFETKEKGVRKLRRKEADGRPFDGYESFGREN
jgi:hypothetical protein